MDSNKINDNLEQNNEIDVIEIIKRLFTKRKFIIKITAVFFVLGVLVALFSAKEYSASTIIVPQSSGSKSSASSLAALIGVNLSTGAGADQYISPLHYDRVLNNVNLQREFINMPLTFAAYDEKISLVEYFTSGNYVKPSLISKIMALPGKLIGMLVGKKESGGEPKSDIAMFTKPEHIVYQIMRGRSSVNIDQKNGNIGIAVMLPDPIAVAEATKALSELLQKYLTKFKIESVLSNYEFIQGRYTEAQQRFENIQVKYAEFKDANRSLTSASAMIEDDKLNSEYVISNTIYKELTNQLLQAEIKLKQDTPVFTVIEPPKIPLLRSKPQRAMLIFIYTFLGGVLSVAMVLLFDFLKKRGEKIKYLDKWN